MKLLMFMRDTLPPSRVDVAVLFDKSLRQLGIHTDYAGPGALPTGFPATACAGRQFVTGPRNDPRTLWRELRLLWRLARQYDMVVVRDKPLVAGALFAIAALRGIPPVYWMSFPMPLGDHISAQRHWSAGRWLTSVLTWVRGSLAQWVQDRFVLPRARHVFVQSQRMLEAVRATAAIADDRISAVPMGVDPDALPPLVRQSALPEGAVPTVAYLGSLDRARQLDVLIDAFALLSERNPGAGLLLVGSAPLASDVQWLKDHAMQRGVLGRTVFTGAMPMALAWERLGGASVCVAAVPPGALHDVSSPTKVVEYLALGLPVVANDIPDQRALLEACGGGICVPFTAPALAQAIGSLLGNLESARERALRARTQVLALRSYDVLGLQVAAALHASRA
jgi:glycosyltransferase involved in cell wall biosynthesis